MMAKGRFSTPAVRGASIVFCLLLSQGGSARWDAVGLSGQPARMVTPGSGAAEVLPLPVLPLRLAEDCPSPDPCEFETNWRACEPVPVYRQPRLGAPIMRALRPNEKFRAQAGEIELIAPGEISILNSPDPAQIGGLSLPPGSKLLAYGPMATSRVLLFDAGSGKGWSPEAASDQLWWDAKVAEIRRVPEMRWWVKVLLTEGKSGWLRLDYVPDAKNFPTYNYAEAIQTWNVDIQRDDESPDCNALLKLKG